MHYVSVSVLVNRNSVSTDCLSTECAFPGSKGEKEDEKRTPLLNGSSYEADASRFLPVQSSKPATGPPPLSPSANEKVWKHPVSKAPPPQQDRPELSATPPLPSLKDSDTDVKQKKNRRGKRKNKNKKNHPS